MIWISSVAAAAIVETQPMKQIVEAVEGRARGVGRSRNCHSLRAGGMADCEPSRAAFHPWRIAERTFRECEEEN